MRGELPQSSHDKNTPPRTAAWVRLVRGFFGFQEIISRAFPAWRPCGSYNLGRRPWCPAISRRRSNEKKMVRAEGLEPTQALRPSGFSYHLRLSPPPSGVCGLDYPFTLPRNIRGLGAARLVSTPSRPDAFRPGLARDCHPCLRWGKFEVSPNLSSSASPVSRRALKFVSSPVRLPFRHARVAGYLTLFIIKQAGGIYTSVLSSSLGDFEFPAGFCFFFALAS